MVVSNVKKDTPFEIGTQYAFVATDRRLKMEWSIPTLKIWISFPAKTFSSELCTVKQRGLPIN